MAGDSNRNRIEAGSFPSKAAVSVDSKISSEFLLRRCTFSVPVNGRLNEVGKQVDLAMGSNQEFEQLDHNFCTSDGYQEKIPGLAS